jgi:hypothetical protein
MLFGQSGGGSDLNLRQQHTANNPKYYFDAQLQNVLYFRLVLQIFESAFSIGLLFLSLHTLALLILATVKTVTSWAEKITFTVHCC